MRLLHIADLHAGKTIGNITRVSRNEDLRFALEQVERICKEEKVSVLLIAGDVFDKKNPDYESLELVVNFLVSMDSHGIHTVIVAGNHDSYDLLKSYKPLNRLAKIHIFDRPSSNISSHIFELENVKIACLPYPSERVLTSIGEESNREYAYKVEKFITALAKEVESAEYRILLSHLMIDSAEIAGSEKKISVLDAYAIRADSLPETFDYVALGHVHKMQMIKNAVPKTYYAGSMYQIDFSEKGMQKFVNLLTLKDGNVFVESIKLDLYRELKEYEIWDDESYTKFMNYHIKDTGSAYVKVVYYMDPTDIQYSLKKEKIIQALGNKLVKLEVRANIKKSAVNTDAYKERDIIGMYIDYYRTNYGITPSEDIIKILKDTIRDIEDETHKTGT